MSIHHFVREAYISKIKDVHDDLIIEDMLHPKCRIISVHDLRLVTITTPESGDIDCCDLKNIIERLNAIAIIQRNFLNYKHDHRHTYDLTFWKNTRSRYLIGLRNMQILKRKTLLYNDFISKPRKKHRKQFTQNRKIVLGLYIKALFDLLTPHDTDVTRTQTVQHSSPYTSLGDR